MPGFRALQNGGGCAAEAASRGIPVFSHVHRDSYCVLCRRVQRLTCWRGPGGDTTDIALPGRIGNCRARTSRTGEASRGSRRYIGWHAPGLPYAQLHAAAITTRPATVAAAETTLDGGADELADHDVVWSSGHPGHRRPIWTLADKAQPIDTGRARLPKSTQRACRSRCSVVERPLGPPPSDDTNGGGQGAAHSKWIHRAPSSWLRKTQTPVTPDRHEGDALSGLRKGEERRRLRR
jgi:hypothetical protein